MEPFVWRRRSRLPGPVLVGLVGVGVDWKRLSQLPVPDVAGRPATPPGVLIGKIGLFEEYLEHLCYL